MTRFPPRTRPALALAALLFPVLAAACGKKGPPLPPLGNRPEPPGAVAAQQVGDALLLGFRLPERYADGRPLEGGTTVVLLRAEPGGRPQELRRLGPDEVDAEPGATFRLTVPLRELFDAIEGERVVVQVAVQGREGKLSPPSAPLPVARAEPPPAPADLSLDGTREGIRLRWVAPDGEPLHYNVYRRLRGEDPWGPPRNGLPLRETEFLDRDVTDGSTYEYQVRATVAAARPPRESAPAQAAPVTRLDRFPPGAPSSVRAVAAPEGIRLFWFPPSDPDLAGFRLYRSTAEQDDWRRVAELPATPPAWVDRDVTPGVSYRYTVTAVDGAVPPNEGPRSEPASEIAPFPGGEDR